MSVGDWFASNAIRIVICIIILSVGVYMTKIIRDRRRVDHLWMIACFITLIAVVGMWFTLYGTTSMIKIDNVETRALGGEESERSLRARREYDPYGSILRAGYKNNLHETNVLGGSGDELTFGNKIRKRFCFLLICPEIPKPKVPERSFFQKNKTRLITTGSSTAAGSGGTYAKRKSHKRAWLIGLLLVVAIGVGLWFIVGEDKEDNN